jgi:ComF family protein
VPLLNPPLNCWLRRARAAALDLLFPPHCAACDAELPEHDEALLVCPACQADLALIDWPVCPRCAAPVPEAEGVRLPCNYCRGVRLRFDRALAVGSYEGLLRDLILRWKEDRQGVVDRAFAELAWRRLAAELARFKFDVVTAVPMSRWEQWRRGVNPPSSLANQLARRLEVRGQASMLWLPRNVPRQMGLSREGRLRNLAGQMKLRSGYHLSAAHVLLVDDILTTGATCSEAARVLKRGGAAEVTVLVLARTRADD